MSGGLVVFNLLTLALIGILIDRVVFGGERMAFIMDLPPYHVPNVRTIGLFVWHNTVVPALQVRSGFYSGLIAFTAATVFLLVALLSPRR